MTTKLNTICYPDYMIRDKSTKMPDTSADAFNERSPTLGERLQLLGADFHFDSNSGKLMALVKSAYRGLPRHRFAGKAPRLKVSLRLTGAPPRHRRSEPPPLTMTSGADLLGGASYGSNFVVMSSQEQSALVLISPAMLEFHYHARYELIEFAVFTLASRVQGLVSLHAACVGGAGRGILMMGPSGAGKSTVALQCLLAGFDFLSEDAVFVTPDTLSATGIANFLHVRADSLRWVSKLREAAAIRRAPVIRRRSGVEKFELDLRQSRYRLAASPQTLCAIVFLSAKDAGHDPLLRPLSKERLLAQLHASQAYAASQPNWRNFSEHASRLPAFELRRGRHPSESAAALRALLDSCA